MNLIVVKASIQTSRDALKTASCDEQVYSSSFKAIFLRTFFVTFTTFSDAYSRYFDRKVHDREQSSLVLLRVYYASTGLDHFLYVTSSSYFKTTTTRVDMPVSAELFMAIDIERLIQASTQYLRTYGECSRWCHFWRDLKL